jgi:hypothetical protein
LVRHSPVEFDELADFEPWHKEIIRRVQPFTMTGIPRSAALVHAICHLSRNQVHGAITECGVWRGGSMMAVALTLLHLGDTGRDLWLYDTFEGMTPPAENDVSHDGQAAATVFEQRRAQGKSWCDAGLEEVKRNLLATGYPAERLKFVRGKVEDTLPASLPAEIALLRLDTDWYESTRHELRHLFPRLAPHGVLIVDDYGHWRGSRKAVDEYFAQTRPPFYLHRSDYTGRMLVGRTQS